MFFTPATARPATRAPLFSPMPATQPQPQPMIVAAAPREPEPLEQPGPDAARLPEHFARALGEWLERIDMERAQGGPSGATPADHIRLLERYEAVCQEEVQRLTLSDANSDTGT